tara:strand:- start:360 stop:1715 length:1356 start_codon:yes stop_codon:yes gene_type:complete
MNIAVTTLATDNLIYQKQTIDNKKIYCAKHGYTFQPFDKSLDESRPFSWSKIKAIQEVFESHNPDWVFWIDGDACIMDFHKKLEDIIDDDFDIMFTVDHLAINCGVFLIKNNETTKKFLDQVYSQDPQNAHPWWEQAAIIEIINHGFTDLKVKRVPQKTFNSYAGSVYDNPEGALHPGSWTAVGSNVFNICQDRLAKGMFSSGDFVLHFAGTKTPQVEQVLIDHCRTSDVCVLSFATEDIDFYAKKIFKSNKDYAKKHGYDWIEHWGVLDDSRPPAWNKILYILKALEKGYDWVFWIDADAIIMNDSIELTKFIDDEYDFILCKDAFSWNTGAWFVKNSEKAKELLKQTYAAEEYTDAFLWEQGAFMNIAFNKGARIKVHQQRDFNSVAPQTKQFFAEGNEYECGTFKFVLNMEEYDKGMYKDGDFILHFASINHEGRNMLLEEFRPDLYE